MFKRRREKEKKVESGKTSADFPTPYTDLSETEADQVRQIVTECVAAIAAEQRPHLKVAFNFLRGHHPDLPIRLKERVIAAVFDIFVEDNGLHPNGYGQGMLQAVSLISSQDSKFLLQAVTFSESFSHDLI